MTALQRLPGVITAAVVLTAIVFASHAPLGLNASEDALLRLAWSAPPQRIERCRQRTPDELARLPQHMRQTAECESTTAEYRLQVTLDGRRVVDRVVRGGGWRRDRPMYVLEEVPLRTDAAAAIQVTLDRIDPEPGAAPAPPAAAPGDAVRGPGIESVPPRLALEHRLHAAPRQVVLVTYDRQRRELAVVNATAR